MLLRRVLRRYLQGFSERTRFLEAFLAGSVVVAGALKVLRRQKHTLSQSKTPSACALPKSGKSNGGFSEGGFFK